jgi:hypothetical protein
MDLDAMRARVRADLRDPEGERWSDETLDRHIARALGEVSLAAPREATAALATSAGSREVDIGGLAGVVSIEGVEYPGGQYPPAFVPFSTWGGTLTLEVARVPSDPRRPRRGDRDDGARGAA